MKFKKRWVTYAIGFLIIIYMVGIASGFYKTEYAKKPVVKEKFEDRDVGYLYNFYVTADPNIEFRPYYGDADAPLTLIVYSSPNEDALKFFMAEIFPTLEQEYIATGKLRYYHKHYITTADLDEQSEKYLYAKILQCAPDFFSLYFSSFKTSSYQELYEIAKFPDLDHCLEGDFPEIIEDLSEVENYGIVGINPRFYIGLGGTDNTVLDGVPSLAKFKRTLKSYQVQIGD